VKKLFSPNAITIARIALIPFGVYAIFKYGGDDSTWQIIAWCIYFLLGLSDLLDGHLARATNQVSELGKFLDPVADKALIGSAMISLSILGRFPWWITAVILAREIGITLFRLAVIKGGVIPANRGGKIKTTFQSFGVGFFMLPLPESLYWFRDGFMAIAIALTIVTGVNYVRLALKKP
jgi:CDP-diacylglycerol--glycerol-3-phosphate 3-phosphatidyltransferase